MKNLLFCTLLTLVPLFPFYGDGAIAIDEARVRRLMDEGRIPGACVIIITQDQKTVKYFGYSDVNRKTPVSGTTSFNIGSCGNPLLAAAVYKLQTEGALLISHRVDRYLPSVSFVYNGTAAAPSISDLLRHTSGITFTTRLESLGEGISIGRAVQMQKTIALSGWPGSFFEYSDMNNYLLAAVIEKTTGRPFYEYVNELIQNSLGMADSGYHRAVPLFGHKIGFFAPRPFPDRAFSDANPLLSFTTAAGDIERWLSINLAPETCAVPEVIAATQTADRGVPPVNNGRTYYSPGWFVSVWRDHSILYDVNLAPHFGSYLAVKPGLGAAVAVIANSGSAQVKAIGDYLLDLAPGGQKLAVFDGEDKTDTVCSLIVFILGAYSLLVAVLLFFFFRDLALGKRTPAVTLKSVLSALGALLACLPFAVGVFFIPRAAANISWEAAIVWMPSSLTVLVILLGTAGALSFVAFTLISFFPNRGKKYREPIPLLLVLSVLSGLANSSVIFIVTNLIYRNLPAAFIVYYFLLALILYIIGRKTIETRLIRLTFEYVYEIRINLIHKIFATNYQNYERLSKGRLLATINNDPAVLASLAGTFVGFITGIITVVCAFVFLAMISLVATLTALAVIAAIAAVYFIVSRNSNLAMEKARDIEDVYASLINGFVYGFHQLKLHFAKKSEYESDLRKVCDDYRARTNQTRINYLHAHLVGDTLLIVVIGFIAFGFSRLFPGFTVGTLMTFCLVLLYLIGPINGILNNIPNLFHIRVSNNRIRSFIQEIPCEADTHEAELRGLQAAGPRREADSIALEDIEFSYGNGAGGFTLGPVSFQLGKGQVLFITGGNGSGKSTLAHLITGLYKPSRGRVRINGEVVPNYLLGEYFSVVFQNYYLFHKIFDIDLESQREAIEGHLKTLGLDRKVSVDYPGRAFTMTGLSKGEVKRLTLLVSYAEDKPIYLFDEWAADQDPEFKKFFYRNILPELRAKGKIVIAITHDDHYFDAADKILKLDTGKIDI